jgi:hypothetical protein
LDFGGFIPLEVVEKKIQKQLQILHEIQETFNQDEEIDKAALENLANIMRNEPQIIQMRRRMQSGRGRSSTRSARRMRTLMI